MTHQMFSVHTTPEEFKNAFINGHFRFVFEENSGREITWLSNSSSLKSVFEKYRFRDGFIEWTGDLTVKVKLRVHLSPGYCGRCFCEANSNDNTPHFPFCTILFVHSWREVVRENIFNLQLIYKLQYSTAQQSKCHSQPQYYSFEALEKRMGKGSQSDTRLFLMCRKQGLVEQK